jgi:predicted metal-dependent enzyme (double-stranded beta helix superfamily)
MAGRGIVLVAVKHIDQAEESRRLQEMYVQMSEGEVRAVADEGYDLTELARHALQAEISRRGLNVQIRVLVYLPDQTKLNY